MGRITGLLLLLWAGATVSTVLDLQKRIIGGETCKEDERLYHVKLIDQNNKFVCGGSLISNQWILTAEHCLKPGRDLKAVVGVHPGPGTPQDITDHEIYKVKDAKGTEWIHDIMLLKLRDPVTGITPVALPDCSTRPNIMDRVQIAGHGVTVMGPQNERVCGQSTDLQCAETDVVDCQGLRNCLQKSYPVTYTTRRYQHLFCAQRAGVDACPGDSGGGVLHNNMIYGVISFTANHTHACVAPLGLMDVCGYIGWIEDTISRPRTLFSKIMECFGCF